MADAVPTPTTRPCQCGAPVVWAATPAGKKMPLDAVATVNGNVYLTWDPDLRGWRATVASRKQTGPAWAEVPRHVHHGTTCPQARDWWHVHEKARPARPDAPGEPSGLPPARHPAAEPQPEQGAMF